jgi:adenylylsulfate reductase subunit B
MSVTVDLKKCNGCNNKETPLCVKNCPGDLMAIDSKTKKAYICTSEDCWDCMVCVKLCPCSAIVTKLPYQLALYKATLVPKVYEDKIKWVCTDINGNKEEFEIKTLEI